MKKKSAIVVALVAIAALVVGLITWYWLTNYHRVTRDQDLPMTGEARFNYLYGLELSLRAMGQRAESYARIDLNQLKLKPDDTLVLYNSPSGLSKAQNTALLTWIETGGHLVIAPPFGLSKTEGVTLLEQLGITSADHNSTGCTTLLPRDKKRAVENIQRLCGEIFFAKDVKTFYMLEGDQEHGYILGQMTRGKGKVTIGTLTFLSNSELKSRVSQELMYQLFADSLNRGRFHLIYDTDLPPLWLLILKHGWVLLLSALVLLCTWLIYRSQRFGPLVASPSQDRRALLEHINSTGEYLFKRRLYKELHSATLNLFISRLRRRDPMTAALVGEALIAALAERTKIDPAKIRHALTPLSLHQKEQFFHSIATLIQLRNQL